MFVRLFSMRDTHFICMNLYESFEMNVRKSPIKTALSFEGTELSYEHLWKRIQTTTAHLYELGLRKGDHVALLLGNTPSFVISFYSCMKLGVTVIPINPTYTYDEIAYIIKNGNAKMLFLTETGFTALQEHISDLSLQHLIICDATAPKTHTPHIPNTLTKCAYMDEWRTASLPVDTPILQDDHTAVILYTSGTTGKPKGAMLTHQNLYSNARDIAIYLQMSNSDRVIATLPIFHIFCLTVCLNATLLSGGEVILVPSFHPVTINTLVTERQATIFAGVPTMYNFLYQSGQKQQPNWNSIRVAVSGGASLPVQLLHNFESLYNVAILEGYGLSETSPVVCFNPLGGVRKPGSVGPSIVNVECKVIDVTGEELPPGEIGEFAVRGPNVMKGYYGMREETLVSMVGGWFLTGDLGYMDEDGYFFIKDRKKDTIITGGLNVYPREVEEVLYQHPHITEVAVIGIPNPDFGETVSAFIVKNNDSITENDIKEFCSSHLAKYKVPRMITFIDALPKNTTGKILRRSLKELLPKSIH